MKNGFAFMLTSIACFYYHFMICACIFHIREDVRTGVCIDYLMKENVCTMKEVTQLLINLKTISSKSFLELQFQIIVATLIFDCFQV